MFTAIVRATSRSAPVASAISNCPKMPMVKRTETSMTRHRTKRDMIGAEAGRGGRAITPFSGGSNASAMASATELSMFTHRICRGVIGRISPKSTAMIRLMLSPPFTGSRKVMTFLRFS